MEILTRGANYFSVQNAQEAAKKIEEMIKNHVVIVIEDREKIEGKLEDIWAILGISSRKNQEEKYSPASEKLTEASRMIVDEVICVILGMGSIHKKPGYEFWEEFKVLTNKLKLKITR